MRLALSRGPVGNKIAFRQLRLAAWNVWTDPPLTAQSPAAANNEFARSILDGLKRTPKYTEPRWLYDAVGAKLFEAICELDTYYVTRVEMGILNTYAADIADALGDGVSLVEPGSGAALKVRPILDALGPRAKAYVPIDIAAGQ